MLHNENEQGKAFINSCHNACHSCSLTISYPLSETSVDTIAVFKRNKWVVSQNDYDA